MKIVITGSESFVGKELIHQCKEKKIEFIGLDIIPKETSDYEYHQINIKSPNIEEYIPEEIDALVHLAALSRDSDCKGRAYDCFENNVMGTLNLIKCTINKKVKQFIFASSEWVYNEFKENQSKDEEDPINPLNLSSEYALSKLTSESNLKQQYLNGFCNTTILRFGIIYGPRKNNWSAVESIASMVKNHSEITVGSLKNGRRFVHVSDIANGIIASFGLKGFNIVNLTGDKIITIHDIVKTTEKLFAKSVKINEKNPSKISIRDPSNKKAKNILKWNPCIDLEMGIKSIQQFI